MMIKEPTMHKTRILIKLDDDEGFEDCSEGGFGVVVEVAVEGVWDVVTDAGAGASSSAAILRKRSTSIFISVVGLVSSFLT